MKIKYNYNQNEMIINFETMYDTNIYIFKNYVNLILKKDKKKFLGQKILIYLNNILIIIFYLTNNYLKKMNYYINDYYLNSKNSFFYSISPIEINL